MGHIFILDKMYFKTKVKEKRYYIMIKRINTGKDIILIHIYVGNISSVNQSCPTLCDSMDYSMPCFPVHHHLLEHAQTHVHRVVMLSTHLILRRPLLLCLQPFPASQSFPRSQLFASGGESIRVSASASVLSMNLQDWFPLVHCFDLLAVQGTLQSLLQHRSSKALILQHSAFFRIL